MVQMNPDLVQCLQQAVIDSVFGQRMAPQLWHIRKKRNHLTDRGDGVNCLTSTAFRLITYIWKFSSLLNGAVKR
jgi:hypothetical protein